MRFEDTYDVDGICMVLLLALEVMRHRYRTALLVLMVLGWQLLRISNMLPLQRF